MLDGGVATSGADRPEVVDEVEMQEQPLEQAALRVLPEDVLARLHEAVTAARYDEIVEIVATIEITQPEMAATLRRMADAFDYDGIRKFLR